VQVQAPSIQVQIPPVQQFIPAPDITPLSSLDGQKLQEMVDLNNTYAALKKQMEQMDSTIIVLNKIREKIVKGIIPLPIMIPVAGLLFYAESNMDKVIAYLDERIHSVNMAKKGIIGSYEHRRDEYVECVIRGSRLLNDKIKNQEIKNVAGIRMPSTDTKTEEDEKKALEKELEKTLTENKE
jgi:hypothetical protein